LNVLSMLSFASLNLQNCKILSLYRIFHLFLYVSTACFLVFISCGRYLFVLFCVILVFIRDSSPFV
jgi:hypothetical protein